MGIIAAYQSDLDGVLVSMKNARRLDPQNPIAYTNLAETYIYLGKISNARRYLKKARKMRAPPVIVEMNEVLAAWRTGDYTEARDLFDSAYGLDPEVVKVWNEAPVAEPIESFEDFTGFCCGHIACGPYMENACKKMNQDVRHRDVSAETARQELVLEMERRRALQEIYGDRRDLEIEVEKPETP
jgi:tetratricopeptide (TPR) repeat protein